MCSYRWRNRGSYRGREMGITSSPKEERRKRNTEFLLFEIMEKEGYGSNDIYH